MSAEELLRKARRIVRSHRVTKLQKDRYNVVGDHGTYLVQLLDEERMACNCPGFRRRGMCSHVMAVLLLKKRKQR